MSKSEHVQNNTDRIDDQTVREPQATPVLSAPPVVPKSAAADIAAAMKAADEKRALLASQETSTVTKSSSASTGKKKNAHSPNHKESRGVPKDYKTTWVPFNLPAEDNERLHFVAKMRNTTAAALCAKILMEQITARKDEFDTYVDEYLKTHDGTMTQALEKMSTEQLQKSIAKTEARMAAIQALLEKKRAQSATSTDSTDTSTDRSELMD